MRRSGQSIAICLPMLLVAALTTVLVGPAAHATPTWLPDISDLSDSGQRASSPQVVTAADGTTIAVWHRSNGTNNIVQAATRSPGDAWTEPMDLSDPGGDAAFPQITTAPDGTTTAVWYRSDGIDWFVQAATRSRGGTWTPPANLSTPGQRARAPQVATAADGTTTAVWYRSTSTGTNNIVQATTRSPGGDWTAPINLSDSGFNAYDPQVATAPDGTTTAVWRSSNGTNWIVQAATRSPGGAWTEPMGLSDPGGDAAFPQVVTAPDGTTTAVWRRNDGANNIVQASTRTVYGWTTAIDVSSEGQHAEAPQVATAADGTITAVWSGNDGSHWIVQTATRSPGGAWTEPTDLSVSGQDAMYPQVTTAPDGTTTTVWYRSDGTNTIVQATTRSPGGAWSAPFDLSAPGHSADFPEVGSAADGTTIALWRRGNGTNDIVQSRVLDHGGPALSGISIPGGGQVNQPLVFQVNAADIWSNPTTITWDLGDGASRTGALVTHAYTTPGSYTVTVTASDAVGNATTQAAGTLTITAAPTPPAAEPPGTPTPTPVSPTAIPLPPAPPPAATPQISVFKLTKKTISAAHQPRATRATITLTQAATVTLAFRKKGTKALRKTVDLEAGTTKVKLTTKVTKKAHLKPGTWAITAVATNDAGQSTPEKTKLRVVR